MLLVMLHLAIFGHYYNEIEYTVMRFRYISSNWSNDVHTVCLLHHLNLKVKFFLQVSIDLPMKCFTFTTFDCRVPECFIKGMYTVVIPPLWLQGMENSVQHWLHSKLHGFHRFGSGSRSKLLKNHLRWNCRCARSYRSVFVPMPAHLHNKEVWSKKGSSAVYSVACVKRNSGFILIATYMHFNSFAFLATSRDPLFDRPLTCLKATWNLLYLLSPGFCSNKSSQYICWIKSRTKINEDPIIYWDFNNQYIT